MLRILQSGNSIPYSWPVDPNAIFLPGQVAQLTTLGNTIVCGTSDGSAPIGIIDDMKSTAFYTAVSDEIVIAGPIVGVMNSNNQLVTPVDVKVELNNANILANSFMSNPIDVELIPKNGVVVFLAGTPLNIDLDGDSVPDGIRSVVSYTYQIPNVMGDDSTLANGRITVWFQRMVAATDQYDSSQRFPINANIFCGLDGKLTTRQPSANHPAIAIVTAPPTAIMSTLEFLWL
jgi:hypothetical protein